MEPLYSVEINSISGQKQMAVYHADATRFDEPVDILTLSAFHGNYVPTPRTLIRALLENCGISVLDLAEKPPIDLRSLSHVWLSDDTSSIDTGNRWTTKIGRLGCVEMMPYSGKDCDGREHEGTILKGIKSYFQMLDLAGTAGIKMDTVALPFLGAGSQNINQNLVKFPLLNECIDSLKRNPSIKRIIFIEKSAGKAFNLASALEKSYSIQSESHILHAAGKSSTNKTEQKRAFISYSTKDKETADLLCNKLENAGVQVWYAPRDIVKDDYASSIVSAIVNASCFITMISKNSIGSQHVLNEIDVAFNRLRDGKSLIPLRLDDVELVPAFEYYLSRFQWMNAFAPGREQELDEIIKRIIS